MMLPLVDFLKQYPNCPLCSDPLHENRRDVVLKYRSVGFTTQTAGAFKLFEMRCNNGHYNINVNRYVEKNEPYNDLFVNSIMFITSFYDISIYISDESMRISYSPWPLHCEVERVLECKDFSKWMISHDEMLDKLNILWSLA